ncbi:DUF6443 domain-containing protein [Aquimarina algiphila]|uniref:DUF6443 domain-containing protein n=1 Tax=Aquimarina algiphila TaxID=2047982 RepID=A0A554VJM8_9FLAO|nr:DUF6443 domain-containing protein [Aquimarina algiphila]TSE08128.1 hypothetical protein FOF46_13810 [Aquimarina algiphila]
MKTYIFKYTYILLLATYLLASKANAESCGISLNSNTVTISNSSGVQYIQYSATCSGPTITFMGVPNWLSVTTVSSSIKITYQSNSSQYRTATITVLANGNTSNGFTVKQGTPPPPPPPCSIIKEIGNHDFTTATASYKDFPFRYSNCVSTPTAYQFTNTSGGALPAWISVSKIGNAFRATVTNNNSSVNREVVIRAISVIGPSVSTTFRVTQSCIRTWYKDKDRDGYASLKVNSCSRPGNDYFAYAIPLGDCNDDNELLHPNTVWYANNDGDNYAATTVTQCDNPGPGYVLTVLPLGDCDDNNELIHPDTIWYIDTDNDQFGETGTTLTQCDRPTGYVLDNNDKCPDESGPNQGCIFTNDNYIFTRVYQEEMTSSVLIQNANDVIESITYYDGIGRPKQQIAIKGSPNEKDIVTHIEYDPYGRETKQYLPYEANSASGGLKSVDINNTINTYYQNTYSEDFTGVALADVNAYSESVFEASPLNRVTEQGAPGKAWKADPNSDTDHTIKFDWGTNVTNDIIYFDVVFDNNNTEKPQLVKNNYYNPNELHVTITKDENWSPADGNLHTTKEYKDKQGRMILKRTYASTGSSSSEAHDIYYVYDRFGNLTYVIPPEVKLSATDGVSDTELAELCYQYKYDRRNRLIEKKIPGKGKEYIIYNTLDQPVLTQDALLKQSNQWLFTKYDAFGRVTYTGLIENGSTVALLRNKVNSSTYKPYEIKTTSPITIAGTPVYYTNDMYPVRMSRILTINYYDNYTFDIDGLTSPTTVYGETIDTNTKSLSTGSKVRVLDTNDWITTVTYYDDKSRPIYVASKNDYLNTTDIIESKLDFVGKVEETKTTHTKGSNAAIVTIDKFEYDHMGRLLTQTQQINTQDTEQIVSNTYDALGQLKQKDVGGVANASEATSPLQQVNYTYNIRGWLTGINDVNTLGNDLFSFRIRYNDVATAYQDKALYNGNISQTYWRTANQDNSIKAYTYSYDALNRITNGISNDGNYNLSNVSYDKMGNILSLNRTGHLNEAATTFGVMDNLGYTYDAGNKLLKVTDTGNTTFGFKEGTNTNDDFTYDDNGNMITDQNKGITGITYNHLNLPKTVSISNAQGTGNISYIYDAIGIKLKKIVTEGTSSIETEYTGNHVYKNGGLEFFNHTEGIVEKEDDGYKYIYQYKDHLGNIRLSYKDSNKNGTITQDEIVEEKNYYPFGLAHKGYNNTINGRKHNYGFISKEENDEVSLEWLDFGARNYDASIGKWMNIDPLADKYHQLSPYNYSANTPLFAYDPDGKDIVFVLDREAAQEYGHVAVLIGDEKNGWTYYSINGTEGGSKPIGFSANADTGTSLVDENGENVLDLGKAIIAANDINPDEPHSYDEYKRIDSSTEEDKNVKKETKDITEKTWLYSIAGPGKSCIDACQKAFKSLVDQRDLDAQWWKVFKDDISGEEDLIPKNWFDKLEKRIKSVNNNKREKSKSSLLKITEKGKVK